MKQLLGLLCVLSVSSAVEAQETASLSMRFLLDNAPPPTEAIDGSPDFSPERIAIPDERLIVDAETKAIGNVIVYLEARNKGIKPKQSPYQPQTHTITTAEGRFTPRVAIVRAGDTLEFASGDAVQYAPAVALFRSPPQGPALPPNRIVISQPEPAPVPITCHIHKWMRAYVLVLDHSFAQSSDLDGRIEIAGLPAMTTVSMRVFHEQLKFDKVMIGGKETRWQRGRFDLHLEPGENALGDIIVPLASAAN